ncbi:MAG: rRNA maturation RNase YbeY [Bdellovibrionales bacterium]
MKNHQIEIFKLYKNRISVTSKMWGVWFSQVSRLLLEDKKLKRLAQKILKTELKITVVLVDLKEGRRLNSQYRKKAVPTDILSFSSAIDGHLGELVFCVPIVKKKAKEHKISLQDEFLYLFIHGMLHLLQYDHETDDKAAQEMYRIQDSVYDKLINL